MTLTEQLRAMEETAWRNPKELPFAAAAPCGRATAAEPPLPPAFMRGVGKIVDFGRGEFLIV